ncbi:tRNA dihydrouridine synthase DusB [Clostridium sp. Marseille-Q2269]|uniref:tRNA dihydrouridine synthase DusB n=1 Tax=Clostridium sp. Marseille-Q2269 TaxID=2942205 RepID=UPI002072BC92|nr:tRNA dihydrouridine synthase DusB [Clostridium sp. Marseille-Q2269]
MNIGEIIFHNNVFLAPMAGFTDIAFREIAKELGCGLVYTEMVSAKALYYGSNNTKELCLISDREKPVALQLFGHEPDIMANAVEVFNDNNDICILDVNMGCPAPKIVKNGDGSALMKDAKLASEIIKAMKKVSKKPITVKFRKGFDKNNINAVEFAKIMEQSGVDAITIHGRTREQMYEGTADWKIISQVKKAVNIPVIGNGDVFSPEDGMKIIEITGCDAIMVGRGAQGNPWIFKQINEKIKGKHVYYPTDEERIDICIDHYKRALKYFEHHKAVREMRKHIAVYIKGLRNCTDIKDKVNMEKDPNKVLEQLIKYREILREF